MNNIKESIKKIIYDIFGLDFRLFIVFLIGANIITWYIIFGAWKNGSYEATAALTTVLVLWFTAIVLIKYTRETKELKEWQKKQVQLSILKLYEHEARDKVNRANLVDIFERPKKLRKIIKDIYERGELNLKDLEN